MYEYTTKSQLSAFDSDDEGGIFRDEEFGMGENIFGDIDKADPTDQTDALGPASPYEEDPQAASFALPLTSEPAATVAALTAASTAASTVAASTVAPSMIPPAQAALFPIPGVPASLITEMQKNPLIDISTWSTGTKFLVGGVVVGALGWVLFFRKK